MAPVFTEMAPVFTGYLSIFIQYLSGGYGPGAMIAEAFLRIAQRLRNSCELTMILTRITRYYDSQTFLLQNLVFKKAF